MNSVDVGRAIDRGDCWLSDRRDGVDPGDPGPVIADLLFFLRKVRNALLEQEAK